MNESKDWNELVVKHEPKLPSNNIKEVIFFPAMKPDDNKSTNAEGGDATTESSK